MDFTELYQQSAAAVIFSPGAHFILNAVADRLVVRRADTLQIARTWRVDTTPSATNASFHAASQQQQQQHIASASNNTDALVSNLAWSSDSEYILAAIPKRGVVNVYMMRDDNWSARIEAGTEGLTKAVWAPDGRTILCFSEWGLRVSAWSLVTGAATHIQFPKHPDKAFAFRPDGRYFILAERHKSKDMIGIYDTSDSFKQVRHFNVPTSSVSSLSISPTGSHIAVWDSPLEYKLCIFTLPGVLLSTFSPEPDPGLGIRCVSWHPSGSFLAVGGYDNKIHILDGLSWSSVAALDLPKRMPPSVVTWREPTNWIEATHGRGFLSYERPQGPQIIPISKFDSAKGYPKTGLLQLEWNRTGSLLLARYENAPTALLIYSFPSPSERFLPKLQTVILQSKPILHSQWNPVRPGSLALCCGTGGFYTWSNEWSSDDLSGSSGANEEVAECIGIPADNFSVRDVRWAPDGKGFVLMDQDLFCCAFEVEDDAVNAEA